MDAQPSHPRQSHEDTPGKARAPRRIVFRIPVTGLLPAFVFVVCATPFAFGAPGLQAVYAIPVAIAYWVLRTRTIVDAEAITVRTLFRRTTLRWNAVRSLRVPERGWVRAVVQDGSEIQEVPLNAVRARHLPVMAVVSDGRVADPTTPPSEAGDTDSSPAEPAAATE